MTRMRALALSSFFVVAVLPAAGSAPRQVPLTRASLLLAVDRLMADRWYPPPSNTTSASEFSTTQVGLDRAIVRAALASESPDLRALAIRSLGRFEDPEQVPQIAEYLDERNLDVQIAAIEALAQALHTSKGEAVLPAVELIRNRIAAAGPVMDPGAGTDTPAGSRAAALAEALGRLKYDAGKATEIENWLWANVPAANVDNIIFVWLTTRLAWDRGYAFTDRTRTMLRKYADPTGTPATVPGRAGAARSPVPMALALEALARTATEADIPMIARALELRCRLATKCVDEAATRVRYAAVNMVNPRWEGARPILEAGLRDEAYQIRLATIRKIASAIPDRPDCRPLVEAFEDRQEIVALEALRLVDPRCDDAEDIARRLAGIAAGLPPRDEPDWHRPARAFESLARFDPAAAGEMLTGAARVNRRWQVRAAAARVALVLRDEASLVMLAGDAEPNVRTEAIAGLQRLNSASLSAVAIQALGSDDHQLIRAAAGALVRPDDPAAAIAALMGTLERLTRAGKDTSRDPRLAILNRLKALAKPDATGHSPVGPELGRLQLRLEDFDPNVAAAAADVIEAATGTRPAVNPTRRPPEQPTAAELETLPTEMVVRMANGDGFLLELLVDDAPLAVARFVTRAREGYYDGLTFHRIVPLFVVQGGSPGANEYMGDARYMRDEIGLARHARGAVGISTRGRDTGDAQWFIDLWPVPRLNYDYTIFARVLDTRDGQRGRYGIRDSMDAVDAMLEGATIVSVR
ncbi:MAG: peptidylprolyl isomerase [Vicinamibacterales bacterium]